MVAVYGVNNVIYSSEYYTTHRGGQQTKELHLKIDGEYAAEAFS